MQLQKNFEDLEFC